LRPKAAPSTVGERDLQKYFPKGGEAKESCDFERAFLGWGRGVGIGEDEKECDWDCIWACTRAGTDSDLLVGDKPFTISRDRGGEQLVVSDTFPSKKDTSLKFINKRFAQPKFRLHLCDITAYLDACFSENI